MNIFTLVICRRRQIIGANNNANVLAFETEHSTYQLAENAARATVSEYLNTDEGKTEIRLRNNSFTWNDVKDIPEEFWKKHGLHPIKETVIGITVPEDQKLN